jgi:hypothetical protein
MMRPISLVLIGLLMVPMRMKLSADCCRNINGFSWLIQTLTQSLGARAPLARGLCR